MAEAKTTKKPAKKTTKTPAGISVSVFDAKGTKKKDLNLPADLFGAKVSKKLLAQYVRVYLSNQRQGTQLVKNRSEVKGSTRKIYKQKGTGRARHGANTAPIFVGGGAAHGPRLRDHRLNINNKQRKKALNGSLSLALKNNAFFVLSGAKDMSKTTDLLKAIENIGKDMKGKVLVVYSSDKEKGIFKASKNAKNVHATEARVLNAYDVLRAGKIICTEDALESYMSLRGKSN